MVVHSRICDTLPEPDSMVSVLTVWMESTTTRPGSVAAICSKMRSMEVSLTTYICELSRWDLLCAGLAALLPMSWLGEEAAAVWAMRADTRSARIFICSSLSSPLI